MSEFTLVRVDGNEIVYVTTFDRDEAMVIRKRWLSRGGGFAFLGGRPVWSDSIGTSEYLLLGPVSS